MTLTIRIDTQAARQRAHEWVNKVPFGWVLTAKEPKRSTEQNDYMWSLLTDIAQQCTLGDRRHVPDTWKAVFLHELGHEIRFVPSLDGSSYVPLGYRSSKLRVAEMTALIESIIAYGTEQRVEWTLPPKEADTGRAA